MAKYEPKDEEDEEKTKVPEPEPECDGETLDRAAVERAKAGIPDDMLIYDCADFFKVFSDSTRMSILWSLDREELCVCDVAAALDMTKSAVSHHLNILRREKLVKFRKDGKKVYYSLDDEHVRAILEMGLEHITER